MNIIIAIVYGLVQGITEFLPVSSSGHLVLLHNFLPLPMTNEFAFDVILHFATFTAVFWYFRFDLWRLFVSLMKSLKTKQMNSDTKLILFLAFASAPAALIGFFAGDYIETTLRQPIVVAIMLVVVGLLFLWAERIGNKNFDLTSLTLNKSLAIGFAQSLALIPGTSRSGISIVAGLFSGLSREAAVRFSFLISLPIIFGAAMIKAGDFFSFDFSSSEYFLLLSAFLSAVISGFFTIKFLLRFARKNKLDIFAYYRFVLAGIIAIIIFY